MSGSKPSPALPEKLDAVGQGIFPSRDRDDADRPIAQVADRDYLEAEAIASEIARRWNAHESLVAALKAAESAFDSSAIACGEAVEDEDDAEDEPEPEWAPIRKLAARVASAEYRAAEIVRAALRDAGVTS